ncbi:Ig-like domain-containing protein [Catenulispora subtropica]|uniref:Ig-like domain-containing protein n=1 Tax=Catenulispora subtropica TaxID=450798 RepID=A0ABN2T121_9ACTN
MANGKLTSVTAQLSGGGAVAGALDASGASWTSANPVGIGHTYLVTAVATGDDGKQQTVTSQFTTAKPANVYTGTYTPDNGTTFGIAQPVSITFDKPIPDKAAVEKQLTVTSDPPVDGAWHWFGSQRVDWRPQQYWAAGTKVTLHMRLDGVKSGSLYGKQNRDATFTIGRALVATMDADAHKMTVTTGGKTTTLLTSSGKPGFETWNGTMTVLEKDQDIRMNSTTVNIFGVNAYDIPHVYWAVRLTPSGTFVHGAPWNEGKFGKVNGSHGCIGLSSSDAEWFFNQVIPGDPVTVVNSKDTVKPDNGFGDWNLSWADWTAGSALH